MVDLELSNTQSIKDGVHRVPATDDQGVKALPQKQLFCLESNAPQDSVRIVLARDRSAHQRDASAVCNGLGLAVAVRIGAADHNENVLSVMANRSPVRF